MARVFVSFLGLGGKDGYNPTVYKYRGVVLEETKFVQRALIEAYGRDYFDKHIILVTEQSKERNWPWLEGELLAFGVDADRLIVSEISEDLTNESAHWEWFERVLSFLNTDDHLVLDLTHGFRIVPIVLSAAVGYLQVSKNVQLDAVLYGADQSGGQIVDFKGFYRVNAWADAVSRLIERADADKMAVLAEQDDGLQFPNLRDPELIQALRDLSGILTNIDVHSVAKRAQVAVSLVCDRMKKTQGAERQMLSLVADKFVKLVVSNVPSDGRYSQAYLEVQVEVTRMLLEHGLNMQAFTVMRELIGSIGMFGLKETKYGKFDSADGRTKYRGRFAEVFISMVHYEKDTWDYSKIKKDDVDILRPWFDTLNEQALISELRKASAILITIRNGFDHAWTSVSAKENVQTLKDKGMCALGHLERVVQSIPQILASKATCI